MSEASIAEQLGAELSLQHRCLVAELEEWLSARLEVTQSRLLAEYGRAALHRGTPRASGERLEGAEFLAEAVLRPASLAPIREHPEPSSQGSSRAASHQPLKAGVPDALALAERPRPPLSGGVPLSVTTSWGEEQGGDVSLHSATEDPPLSPDAKFHAANMERLKTRLQQHQEESESHAMRHSHSFADLPYDVAHYESEEGRGMKGLVAHIVSQPYFEVASLSLIMCSCILMGVQEHLLGLRRGKDLGLPTYYDPFESLPGMAGWLANSVIFFNLAFTLELLIRLFALRLEALKSRWIWLDGSLVIVATLEWCNLVTVDVLALRLVRLIRMLRIVRLGRLTSSVEALFLLMRSIQASIGALFWSLSLIMLLQTGVGIVIMQMVGSAIESEDLPREQRLVIYEYFGTFTKTQITMFETMFANWVKPCRCLMTIQEYYGVVFIAYRCVLGFAILRVITAVFIQETNSVVEKDAEVRSIRKNKANKHNLLELDNLFKELDTNGDGYLTWEEFTMLTGSEEIKMLAEQLDIKTVDLEHMFHTIDMLGESNGQISYTEFVDGLRMMRHPAVSIDVLNVLKHCQKLEDQIGNLTMLVEGRSSRSRSLDLGEKATPIGVARTPSTRRGDREVTKGRITHSAGCSPIPI